MRESTERLFVAVANEIGTKKPTAKQRHMMSRIKADYYHEYAGPLAMPLHQLCADLENIGLRGLVDRVVAGDFDAGAAEVDEWAHSAEGRRAFAQLTRGLR